MHSNWVSSMSRYRFGRFYHQCRGIQHVHPTWLGSWLVHESQTWFGIPWSSSECWSCYPAHHMSPWYRSIVYRASCRGRAPSRWGSGTWTISCRWGRWSILHKASHTVSSWSPAPEDPSRWSSWSATTSRIWWCIGSGGTGIVSQNRHPMMSQTPRFHYIYLVATYPHQVGWRVRWPIEWIQFFDRKIICFMFILGRPLDLWRA